MSPLTLTLRRDPQQRLDLAPLTPDRLAGSGAAQIAALPLQLGNRRLAVGELFEIRGDDATQLVIRNGSARLDAVGSGLASGSIRVEGDVGDRLGRGMRAGTLVVEGSCGAYAGSAMRGGTIEVRGDCGEFAGSALPGERRGMRAGTLVVRGTAGDRAGDHMRGGRILVAGDAGGYCGSRMIAGTIVVLGRLGACAGYGMTRGTLLASDALRPLLVTFNDAGEHELTVLRLLQSSLRRVGGRFAALDPDRYRVHRYVGDRAVGGKGELLVWL